MLRTCRDMTTAGRDTSPYCPTVLDFRICWVFLFQSTINVRILVDRGYKTRPRGNRRLRKAFTNCRRRGDHRLSQYRCGGRPSHPCLRADLLPVADRARGFCVDQARRPKQLENETSRLKRAEAELTLNNQILRETAERNFCAPTLAVSASNTSGQSLRVLERRACKILEHPPSIQRHEPQVSVGPQSNVANQ